MGKSGAGHFVKMVHNGIEYGMMQALAEGFAVMKASDFGLDLTRITDVYNHRSVIESRLVGWLQSAFEQYGEDLKHISGSAAQSGEGMWTVEAGKELGVPMPVIQGALDYRLQSQKNPSYTGKLISAMRNQFGGHDVKAKK
jgi:6-phosphogluconate dehydrogenase